MYKFKLLTFLLFALAVLTAVNEFKREPAKKENTEKREDRQKDKFSEIPLFPATEHSTSRKENEVGNESEKSAEFGSDVARKTEILREGADVLEEGREGFRMYCSGCHDIYSVRTAPPILNIAKIYRRSTGSKENFIRAIEEWVTSPSYSRSKLCGCVVRRFGLMPPIHVEAEKLRSIALWLWEISGDGMIDEGRREGTPGREGPAGGGCCGCGGGGACGCGAGGGC